MALDKVIDSAALDADLLTVAKAIRAKGGTSDQLAFPDGFVSAVEGIQTGGGGTVERTAWYRPPDWPDITSLPMPETYDADGTPLFAQYLYFLVDTQINTLTKTATVTKKNTVGTIERGHIENGDFVVDKAWADTRSAEIDWDVEGERYVIFRAYSNYTSSYKDDAFSFPVSFPAIEVYGHTQGNRWKFCWCGMPSIQALTLTGRDVTFSGLGSVFLPSSAVYIDFSGVEWIDGVRMLASRFAQFRNLQVLKLPTNTLTLSAEDTAQSNWPSSMCNNCQSLRTLDLSMIDTTAVTDISTMFDYCYSLHTLNISGWNLSSVTKISNTFRGCDALVNLITDGCTMPSVSFSLSTAPLLSAESLNGVITALPMLAEGTTATLTLGTTNKAKLTADEIAVATGKGWTVA